MEPSPTECTDEKFNILPTLQVKKLATDIPMSEVTDFSANMVNRKPIAPLISAEFISINSIFLRIFVFVSSDNVMREILFGYSTDGPSNEYRVDHCAKGTTGYFDLWYIEAEIYHYEGHRTFDFQLTVINNNRDPRTSRGTKTIVSTAVGNN